MAPLKRQPASCPPKEEWTQRCCLSACGASGVFERLCPQKTTDRRKEKGQREKGKSESERETPNNVFHTSRKTPLSLPPSLPSPLSPPPPWIRWWFDCRNGCLTAMNRAPPPSLPPSLQFIPTYYNILPYRTSCWRKPCAAICVPSPTPSTTTHHHRVEKKWRNRPWSIHTGRFVYYYYSHSHPACSPICICILYEAWDRDPKFETICIWKGVGGEGPRKMYHRFITLLHLGYDKNVMS